MKLHYWLKSPSRIRCFLPGGIPLDGKFARFDAEESFRCSGTIIWHGITIQSLDYLPEENLVDGYMGFIAEKLEDKRNTMEHLRRLDRGKWHGFVRLDDIEKLEICPRAMAGQATKADQEIFPVAPRCPIILGRKLDRA